MYREFTKKTLLPVAAVDSSADEIACSIQTAGISLRMEEFLTTNAAKALCLMLLTREITFEQYFALVVSMSGVEYSTLTGNVEVIL